MRIPTWTAYFIFIFVGYNALISGPIAPFMAHTLQVTLSEISYAVAIFAIGRTIAIRLGPALFLGYPFKALYFFILFGTVSLTIGIALSRSLAFFFFCWLFLGIFIGFLTFLVNSLIVSSYDQHHRTAKLNLLNFAFSLGAISSPFMAGWLLNSGLAWQVPYLLSLILLIPTLLGFKINPHFVKPTTPQINGASFIWTSSLCLTTYALFAYVLAEIGFCFWLTPYLMNDAGFSFETAAFSLSLFWTLMAVGRFASGYLSRMISLKKFLHLLMGFSLIGFAGSIWLLSSQWAFFWVALAGLGCSGLYATILSRGTLLLSVPSAKLTSSMVTIGSFGTVAAMVISGLLKNHLSIHSLLIFYFILLFTSAIAISLSFVTENKSKRS